MSSGCKTTRWNFHYVVLGILGIFMNELSNKAISILQKQAMLVRQLEEEVVKTRQHAKETNPEIKAHIEGLQLENDHLTREVAILKETIKVLF